MRMIFEFICIGNGENGALAFTSHCKELMARNRETA